MKTITDELINSFKEYLLEQEKSENTVTKYIRDVRMFAKKYKGEPISKQDVLSYKEKLIQEYTPRSVNSMLSSLNSFFDFLNWHDMKVKTLKVQKMIFSEKRKELTKEEYDRLLCAAESYGNQKLYYLMQTICSTGIRVSELKFITYEALRQGQALIRCKGKIRVVIIPKKLCKMLACYAKKEKIKKGSIFVTRTGKPLDRSNIWKLLKKLCETARVDKNKVFPHNLRHLFARTYYSLQKDIVRLADILGYSNINTTRIYTIESGDIHRIQIEKLGLLRC